MIKQVFLAAILIPLLVGCGSGSQILMPDNVAVFSEDEISRKTIKEGEFDVEQTAYYSGFSLEYIDQFYHQELISDGWYAFGISDMHPYSTGITEDPYGRKSLDIVFSRVTGMKTEVIYISGSVHGNRPDTYNIYVSKFTTIDSIDSRIMIENRYYDN